VLICNPFGQESIRAQRALRIVADRIARTGCSALRFDWYGTGDSDGDDEEVSIDRWIEDLQRADHELRVLSGCVSTTWVGLRLGATMTALASSSIRTPPVGLVWWDAVVDGAAYLRSLDLAHRSGLELAFPIPPPGPPLRMHIPDGREAMGFAVPAAFSDAIARIGPAAFEQARCERATWLVTDTSRPPAAAPSGASVSVQHVPAIDWTTDEAMNTSIVPAAVVDAIAREACSR
jgi:hypothetical protein